MPWSADLDECLFFLGIWALNCAQYAFMEYLLPSADWTPGPLSPAVSRSLSSVQGPLREGEGERGVGKGVRSQDLTQRWSSSQSV